MTLRSLLDDLRHAWRWLRRNARFHAAVWLVLSAGIGVTGAMFGISRLLLQPSLPFPQPERLVTLWATQPGNESMQLSLRDFYAWKARVSAFEGMAVIDGWLFAVSAPGAPTSGVVGVNASGDFFGVLGVQPLLGRWFDVDDDRIDATPVAVIGAGLWRRLFASAPDVVGREVEIDARMYTVIGVAPEGFSFSYPHNEPVELWVPMARGFRYFSQKEARGAHQMYGIGRLRRGVTLEQANHELAAAAHHERLESTDLMAAGARAEAMTVALAGSSRGPALLALGAVLLMFLAVCANVVGLLLARAQERRPEWALRSALGATPARLARQVSIETLLLFSAAALPGTLAAHGLVQLVRGVVASIPRTTENYVYELMPSLSLSAGAGSFDAVAAFFCVGLSLSAGLAASLFPALRVSRTALSTTLQESGLRATAGRVPRQLWAGMIVVQIAAAFTLLACAGVALRGCYELLHAPVGFRAQGLVAMRLIGADKRYASPERMTELYRRFRDLVEQQPGVSSSAVNTALPLGGYTGGQFLEVEGRLSGTGPEAPRVVANMTSHRYLETMGIPLLRGRDLSLEERRTSAPLALINQSLAARYFPGEPAIGHHIRLPDFGGAALEIVGVVGDVRRFGLARAAVPEVFIPVGAIYGDFTYFVARSEQPQQLLHELPRLLASIDPSLGIEAWRMDDNLRASVALQRLGTAFVITFAVAGLGLAVLATHALIAFSVEQRSRELGIRLALGAPREAVIWLVTRDALTWLVLGLAFGGVAARGMVGPLVAWIVGTSAFDPLVYGGVAAVLGGTILLASIIPAWRATQLSLAAVLSEASQARDAPSSAWDHR